MKTIVIFIFFLNILYEIYCFFQNFNYVIKNRKKKNNFFFVLKKIKKQIYRNNNCKLFNIKECTNFYKIKNPLKCKIIDIKKLTKENAIDDVYNIEIDHNGNFKYIEGQSCGIIPYYLENIENKIKNVSRLYSISSINDSKVLSIAVKIHKYYEIKNEKKILKYGYASNYVKNLKKNYDIYLTGSYGHFVLPTDTLEKNKNFIFIATGTGISPFISFLKKIFNKTHNKNNKKYNGIIHLFYGIKNEDSIIYMDELEYFKKCYPNNLHIEYVFSSKQELNDTPYHVQHKILSMKNDFLKYFNDLKSELYICGHKNMKFEILNILKTYIKLDEITKKRIHIEVY